MKKFLEKSLVGRLNSEMKGGEKMKKGFITMVMALVVSVMVLPVAAFAVPTLGDVLDGSIFDNAALDIVNDSGAEAVVLTDTDGVGDDITAFLLFEFAGFAPDLTFGIYDFDVDTAGNVTLGNTLELFEGGDTSITATTVDFNLTAGTATASGVTANIDTTFGFYLTTPEDSAGYTYYSHTALNADGFNHTLIFDLLTDSYDRRDYLLGSDVIVAFEDLNGGGDQDYNDFVVGVTDVNPVPEPATLILLGSGLAGLALYGRRKKQYK